MTDPTPLSPAAASVLDAVTLKRWDVPHQACPKSLDQIKSDVAAALRAAANQVLPHSAWGDDRDSPAFYRWQQKMKSRSWFLSIAAELDGGAQ